MGVWFELHIVGLASATLLPVSLVLGNINPITPGNIDLNIHGGKDQRCLILGRAKRSANIRPSPAGGRSGGKPHAVRGEGWRIDEIRVYPFGPKLVRLLGLIFL